MTSSIRHTADKIGVSDSEMKTSLEILNLIEVINPKIYTLLQDYIEACLECYLNWSAEKISHRKDSLLTLLNELNTPSRFVKTTKTLTKARASGSADGFRSPQV